MPGPSIRWFSAGATALAASILLAGCAVGPDFLHPAAPDIDRYTLEVFARQTSSTDAPTGHILLQADGGLLECKIIVNAVLERDPYKRETVERGRANDIDPRRDRWTGKSARWDQRHRNPA